MLQRQRRGNFLKKAVVLFVFFLLCFSVVYFIFFYLFLGKNLIINPVVKNTEDFSPLVAKKLARVHILFSSIRQATGSSYLVTLADGGEIVLSLEKNIDKQISSLQPILKQLTIEGKSVKRIDFRFDKPVIEYL